MNCEIRKYSWYLNNNEFLVRLALEFLNNICVIVVCFDSEVSIREIIVHTKDFSFENHSNGCISKYKFKKFEENI